MKTRMYRLIIYLTFLIVIYRIPLEWIDNQRLCIWYHLFNFDCLGCGFTRAFFHFMHAHIDVAFAYNKMVLFVPLGLLLLIQDSWTMLRRSSQLSWVEVCLRNFIAFVYPKRD